MGESIYKAFATSVLRTALKVAGGWLVARGLVADGLMQDVAAGLALVVVTQAWDFWRIHRRVLYQRWLLVLGIAEPATRDPGVADAIRSDAQYFTKQGLQP